MIVDAKNSHYALSASCAATGLRPLPYGYYYWLPYYGKSQYAMSKHAWLHAESYFDAISSRDRWRGAQHLRVYSAHAMPAAADACWRASA